MLSGAEGKSAALPVPTPLYPKKNEKLRLAWAEEHIQFTTDELTWIILSEQTHINDSPVVAEFTTRKTCWRRIGELLYCISVQKERFSNVLGLFNGSRAGPFLFWELGWGKITDETYHDKILPSVEDFSGLVDLEFKVTYRSCGILRRLIQRPM